MKKSILVVALITLVTVVTGSAHSETTKDPKKLVKEMVDANGGIKQFRALKDVSYTYTYHDTATDKRDVSTEKYIFDGEYSWAEYHTHEKFVMPNVQGTVTQSFNGAKTKVHHDGALVTDKKAVEMAHFLRKTNYYWFAMMFKLLDPGLNYSYEGTKKHNDITYDLVKVGFEQGIGEASDIYLLYINPETKMVDQFLFTVMSFGKKDPFMMTVEYETVSGVKFPTKRKYTTAKWDGTITGEKWVHEISTKLSFNNGYGKEMF